VHKARCLRKPYNLPASPRKPAASCHITCVQIQPRPNVTLQPIGCSVLPVQTYPLRRVRLHAMPIDLVMPFTYDLSASADIDRETSRHRPTVTHIAMSSDSTIAWKARQRTHRRRFVRPPRFQSRAGLKIVGAANELRNTPREISRNPFDDGGGSVLGVCCSVASECKKASF
jgi:hypothetical protein